MRPFYLIVSSCISHSTGVLVEQNAEETVYGHFCRIKTPKNHVILSNGLGFGLVEKKPGYHTISSKTTYPDKGI